MKKDLIFIIGGRIIQILISLVSIRLLTTFLSVQEVGNYYLATSILAFLNLVLLNPPGVYFSRHLLQWQKTRNLFNALAILIVFILIVAILSIPLIYVLFSFSNYHQKFSYEFFTLYIILSVLISTIHRNVMFGTNTLGYRKKFVSFLVLTLIFSLMFSIGLVLFIKNTALNWLFGLIIAQSLTLYFLLKSFVQDNDFEIIKIKNNLTLSKSKKVFKFIIPISFYTLLMWGLDMSYRFIVDYKYSPESLGFIAVGLSVSSSIFSSAEAIAMQYFSPIYLKNILDASKDERAKAWNKMADLLIPMYLILMFFIVAMSKLLVNILLDDKFYGAYIFTIIGGTLEFFRVLVNLLNKVSQSELKTSFSIKPYLIGSLFSVSLLIIFDFSNNLMFVPLILSISYFLVSILMYKQMKKLLEIKIKLNFIKCLFYSLPFGLIFLYSDQGGIFNILILGLFGLYFLFIIRQFLYHKP